MTEGLGLSPEEMGLDAEESIDDGRAAETAQERGVMGSLTASLRDSRLGRAALKAILALGVFGGVARSEAAAAPEISAQDQIVSKTCALGVVAGFLGDSRVNPQETIEMAMMARKGPKPDLARYFHCQNDQSRAQQLVKDIKDLFEKQSDILGKKELEELVYREIYEALGTVGNLTGANPGELLKEGAAPDLPKEVTQTGYIKNYGLGGDVGGLVDWEKNLYLQPDQRDGQPNTLGFLRSLAKSKEQGSRIVIADRQARKLALEASFAMVEDGDDAVKKFIDDGIKP